MARHWVPETAPDPRRTLWTTTAAPDTTDEYIAEVHPIVPAARRPVHTEAGAPEAVTA